MQTPKAGEIPTQGLSFAPPCPDRKYTFADQQGKQTKPHRKIIIKKPQNNRSSKQANKQKEPTTQPDTYLPNSSQKSRRRQNLG